MFFPQKILSIKKNDLVLEIGPGSNPFHRSDVFLDKIFESPDEEFSQQGYASKENLKGKPLHVYEGGVFPFKDNQFDYVICSHVIEHVPVDQLPLFISELQRVAKKGYLEYPTFLYELINNESVHTSLISMRDGKTFFLDKKKVSRAKRILNIYKRMVFRDIALSNIFGVYKDIFFVGFEWNKSFDYEIVPSWEKFMNTIDDQSILNKVDTAGFLPINRVLVTPINSLIMKFQSFFLNKKKFYLSKKARVDNQSYLKVGDNTNIQDYVHINTNNNLVTIGKNCQINPFTVIYGHNQIMIGDNVMVAPHVMISSGNHDTDLHDLPMRFSGNKSTGPILISDDVWIGANSTITDGVKIGKGAVIGANSVVTKNVQEYEVVAGCPAKRIKFRK